MSTATNKDNKSEEEQLLREWQIAMEQPAAESKPLHPAFAVGLGGFVIVNVGLLLSIPPVLMGRGAPYLPTFANKLDRMFAPLQSHFRGASSNSKISTSKKLLTFVDLGSGDGRVVFRAAREGLFHKSIGYEINPFLHIVAQSWRYMQAPRYLSTTNFYVKDLWKVDLSNVDVVAVYGLNPIMKDLGTKMKDELQPGSVVLSNVFSIPGWRQSTTLSREGMHIYVVPDCWKKASTESLS